MGDFTGHEAPTALGSIYGYRYWYVDNGRLVSVTARDIKDHKSIAWKNGENVAICNRNRSHEYVKQLGPRPMPPDLPSILEAVPPKLTDTFSSYVARARLNTPKGWRFPTTEQGSVLIPDFEMQKNEEWQQKLDEAQKWYEEAQSLYIEALATWYEDLEKLQNANPKEHNVPELGCRCGFYMVKEPHHAKAYANANDRQLVFGVVEGYGKVVVGDLGWRFEKARIVGLVFSLAATRDRKVMQIGIENTIELRAQTIGEYNAVSGYYEEAELYDTVVDLRKEWDERVSNS